MNALEIRGLTKQYKDFQLKNLNLTLPSGCIMGLIGENGAGKTTTIQLILGAIARDGGTVSVLGQDNLSAQADFKEEIGVVLDESCLPTYLNARQIGNVMAGIYRNWDRAAYDNYLKIFALPEKKLMYQFSRGMKMKLAVAVALSHHPKLLILDEATSGLDPVVRDEILEIFLNFTRQEDHSILISSHILSDLEKICDYIAYLHRGSLLFCEEKDTLLEKYGLLKCTAQELASLDKSAILAYRQNPYGVEALVIRDQIPQHMTPDRISIEDIIVFQARGEHIQ